MAANVLRDLRTLRVQVIHPPDQEGKALVEHLRRIGCTVETSWPLPAEAAANAEVVMLAVDYDLRDDIRRLLRARNEHPACLIAVVDYENPATLQIVLECGALAVVEKPIRPFGLLTNIAIARTLWQERIEVQRRLRKVESKLAGIQKIQRAKTILMQGQGLSEDDAYVTIRQQAMAKRMPMEQMASAIINAHELLTAHMKDT